MLQCNTSPTLHRSNLFCLKDELLGGSSYRNWIDRNSISFELEVCSKVMVEPNSSRHQILLVARNEILSNVDFQHRACVLGQLTFRGVCEQLENFKSSTHSGFLVLTFECVIEPSFLTQKICFKSAFAGRM